MRSVEMLALPCYIASLHAATQLVTEICPAVKEGDYPSLLPPAIEEIKKKIGSTKLPEGYHAGKQKEWDDLVSLATGAKLLQGCNQIQRARLLAASKPHTAAWIQAIPVTNLGLHLDADTVRVAVALRLGSPICEPHTCRHCNRQVDQQGLHGLSCAKSAGRLPRHASLNDVVKRSLASAGLPSVLEPLGLDRGDGKRPDGLTLFPFKRGQALAWDATCVDTYASSSVVKSAAEPGSAATSAELRKLTKYKAISDKYIFVPVAVETAGVLGPSTTRFLSELGARISAVTGDIRETQWLHQRISVAVVRGNAAAVLSTACARASGSAGYKRSRVVGHEHPNPTVPGYEENDAEKGGPSQIASATDGNGAGDYREPVNDAVSCPSEGGVSPDCEMLAMLTALEPVGISLDSGADLIVSPRSDNLLDSYRRVYSEMRSAMKADELRQCRDPLADPELARYLSRGVGRKSDECGVSECPICGSGGNTD